MPAADALLAVRVLGAGPPLVLINGYAASKDDWDPGFLDELAAASTVVCPDNRGIGASPPAGGDLSVAEMAADVLALMDARGIDVADVAGWSMGGFVAQALAAAAPERVRRLVLLSTDGGGPGAEAAQLDVWSALIDHGGTPREQATRLLGLLFPAGLAASIDAQFGEVVAAARASLLPGTLAAQEAAMKRWHAEPADARLRAISAPVLIAAGTGDQVIPPANAELLAGALPGSRLVLFEGGGHAFMAQEPAPLAGLITEWLGR
jgi:pimeloyl-ACP methyl ester carboxylesterase